MEPVLSKSGDGTRHMPVQPEGGPTPRLVPVPDARSVAFGIAGGAGYFLLANMALTLWQMDPLLGTIWLPNACMVALLLLARLRNEIPLVAAIAIGCGAAHFIVGYSATTTAIQTLAHLVDVVLVTWLVRKSDPDLTQITGLMRLGPVLQYGGVVGPLALCLIAGFALGPDLAALSAWLLADSMGMILVVPAALVIAQVWQEEARGFRASLAERVILMSGGLVAVYFVFQQNLYPLMFLIPPVTLLIAFRVGALGTALYVPGLALVAAVMTYQGIGPIAQSLAGEAARTHLLQVFIAANFLTGLPIAAILAGRAEMTSELTRSRSELAMLAESITDAVLWVDSQRLCTYASPSVQQVLGFAPQDMVGRAIRLNGPQDAQEEIVAVLDRLLSGESEKERMTYRRSLDDEEGAAVFIEADCARVLDPAGERSGIIISARDVTERVELERELTNARSRAEDAAHAKTEFLANMSHEIRTPMNGVLGFAELMLQRDLDEESRAHTEMIVQSGRSMMLLLNDILDLSKIEAGQIVIDHEPVDVFAMVQECTALHKASAERKGLALRFHSGSTSETDGGPPSEGPWVMSDALRLRQIILNLVGNAVKFTESGGVDIVFEREEQGFAIVVEDTGIGISPNRIETIFAPFTQAESNTARRFGGTGLGLTISRQLAELLGGEITAESTQGEGSAFRLSVPAEFVDPVEPVEPPQRSFELPTLPRSASILLVEDHNVNRALGVEMLERCGQAVATAHDGNEAIAMVIDAIMRDVPFDLVLMDIQMPGCDGYAATRAIRADGIGPDQLPIIALTANAFPEDILAAREAGMQAHLAKPLVFADLARALQRWLPTRIVEAGSEVASVERVVANPATSRETEIVDTSRPAGNTVRLNDGHSGPVLEPQNRALYRPATPKFPPQRHSAAMLNRWTARRGEAVEAVRDALAKGELSNDELADEGHEGLARLVHKLAGTAAIFGEPELGDQAAALEHALRIGLSAEVREALAFELLSVADDPEGLAPVEDS